ncbi:hypothetical protein LOZ35_000395 [Ophidiomyces ophidiicola]|nr:hypothetical protein LOZ35_000395 [Ophidiomyces ophidiicola]
MSDTRPHISKLKLFLARCYETAHRLSSGREDHLLELRVNFCFDFARLSYSDPLRHPESFLAAIVDRCQSKGRLVGKIDVCTSDGEPKPKLDYQEIQRQLGWHGSKLRHDHREILQGLIAFRAMYFGAFLWYIMYEPRLYDLRAAQGMFHEAHDSDTQSVAAAREMEQLLASNERELVAAEDDMTAICEALQLCVRGFVDAKYAAPAVLEDLAGDRRGLRPRQRGDLSAGGDYWRGVMKVLGGGDGPAGGAKAQSPALTASKPAPAQDGATRQNKTPQMNRGASTPRQPMHMVLN